MGGVGRPTKMTPEVVSKLIHYISEGNFYEPACILSGTSYGTFRAWMRKGEEALAKIQEAEDKGEEVKLTDDEDRFYNFRKVILEAEALNEARLVELWKGAAVTDWKAAKDLLAHRYADRWAQSKNTLVVEHSGNVDLNHKGGVDINARIAKFEHLFDKAAERHASQSDDRSNDTDQPIYNP